MLKKLLWISTLLLFVLPAVHAQQSVARRWNEALIQGIREDFARPPVHARNLFHSSIAMYDAWAVYDTIARPYLLGNTVGNYTCSFTGIPAPANVQAARNEAISFAVYRVLVARFQYSPNAFITITRFNNLMLSLGYDYNNTSTDYSTGSPAALGNYIGECVVLMGYGDGSNELSNYFAQYYHPVNPPLVMANPGNTSIQDPNRWQPLQLTLAIDQNGNPIPSTQSFQSPEWGNVYPFALTEADKTVFTRDGDTFLVYHDPGQVAQLDTAFGAGQSDEFKWNHELVSVWGSHLDPTDGVMWDISPAAQGNNASYPTTLAGLHDFYDYKNGGDHSPGRPVNPKTGQPYAPNVVPRGDYTRVLAQFWADGPASETPPGHWFAILNKVMDHPDFQRRFNGKGPLLDNLEWDVKAYFTLGGAVHDAAVTAWGIKGWYDSVRPVSALRYMADQGQSSDPGLPHYDPAGVRLDSGLVELVQMGDPLAGANNENVGKIKFYTWRGPLGITDPFNQFAGVGWILGENWWPYQRKTFVTPPFAGYISGHSTYSRSAAEVLTLITGDEYFPGGVGEFHITANSGFLGLEKGPSVDVTLQWATYRDASDQTSLSRIWGGIHPPMDDIPGRLLGSEIGHDAFNLAKLYFYKDADNDGFLSYEDCDDHNAANFPGAPELCDGVDNDCNGQTDDNLPTYTYFADVDGDGYGTVDFTYLTCETLPPFGYVTNSSDCNDDNPFLSPANAEACDGIDNDCNGLVDDLPLYTYYLDADGDGFGNSIIAVENCLTQAPVGFVSNNTDCNDNDAAQYPGATEICDIIDNDCNGQVDDLPTYTYYVDGDGDGFGDATTALDTCLTVAPAGYVANGTDCNDTNSGLYPGSTELCDDLDNDCNGLADDGLSTYTYYVDLDGDGFGVINQFVTSCLNIIPVGFSAQAGDCNDSDAAIFTGAQEICDGIDNNCNGSADEGLTMIVFYLDADGDSFGTATNALDTCQGATAPLGYVSNNFDCNDASALAYPGASEVLDGLDNDCNGLVDDVSATNELQRLIRIFPNPVSDQLTVYHSEGATLQIKVINIAGQTIKETTLALQNHAGSIDFSNNVPGMYLVEITEVETGRKMVVKVVKE